MVLSSPPTAKERVEILTQAYRHKRDQAGLFDSFEITTKILLSFLAGTHCYIKGHNVCFKTLLLQLREEM